MHFPNKAEMEQKSKEMMRIAFEYMPALSDGERALLINIGSRLYNQGGIDLLVEIERAGQGLAPVSASESEHKCDTDGEVDVDICKECRDHACFCSICGLSECCGSKSYDPD